MRLTTSRIFIVAVGTLGRGMLVGDFNQPASVAGKPATALPMTFHLSQNYPNPFNPNTRIAFELPTSSQVTLRVFDVNGRTVSELLNNQLQSSGRHEVIFTPRGFASGAYFYELKAVPLHSSAAPFAARKAMSLIK